MKILAITISLLLISTVSENQEILKTFHSGNEAFLNNHYANAVDQYKVILRKGYNSPELYFNTGLAYLKLHDHANARLFLERAHHQRPLDLNFRMGLQDLREEIGDTYDFPRLPFFKVVPTIRHHLGHRGAFYLTIMGWWSFALLWYFRKVDRRMRYYLVISSCMNIIFITSLILDLVLNSIENEYAIINKPSITLYSQPDPNSEPIEDLSVGIKISIKEDFSSWTHVMLGNGSSGWVAEHPYTYILE